MTRSLDNLFDEPQRSSNKEPSGPGGNDFDALLDEQKVDTKQAIDPSWDKVRANDKGREDPRSTPQEPAAPSLEDDDADDLMGLSATTQPSKPTTRAVQAAMPPEPRISPESQGADDAPASFPWWVIIAAILLILAGAAAVVTFG